MKAPEEPFNWTSHKRRERKGLVIFSGDLFNPSVESSVTRGSHMVPVINSMQVDCAVLGKYVACLTVVMIGTLGILIFRDC